MGYEWLPLLLTRLDGIEPYEVRQILEENRRRWPRRATAKGLLVLTVWGGRCLIVTLRPTEISHDWLIIGAREMSTEEAAEYDRWEADHE